jgi:transcriptional regulator GlxA family with amidase domain
MLGLSAAAAYGRDRASPAAHATHQMKSAAEKIPVAVLFYENAILFDYGPPAEIFRAAEWTNAFNVFTVAESTSPMANRFFPHVITAQYPLRDAPKPEVLIVGGGEWSSVARRSSQGDRKMLQWIGDCLASGTTVLGVCTGAYILALAGVLDGRRATSLPIEIKTFRSLAPKTEVHEDMLFVDDGNIVTTSGGYAGIVAALHLVRRIRGTEAARFIAHEYLNYDAWDQSFTGKVKS